MASRSQLVEGWRLRLAENRRLLTEGAPRRRWIRQIYIHIYAFLVSCYGGEDWRADQEREGTSEGQPTRMEFVDHTLGEKGAQPKSAERIRATLDAVHAACDSPPASGELSDGLRYEDWIAVASESGLLSPDRCVRLLKRHGLVARKVRRGDDVIVEVYAGQRSKAMKLLEDHEPALKIVPRSRQRSRRAIGVVGGGVAGAFLGIPVGLLLAGILDKEYELRLSPTGGQILWAVFTVSWLCSIVVGVLVGVWSNRRRP
jgi:hypothetical protein